MIVVDSSVWIDFLNGIRSPQVARLFDRLGEEPILVGDLILLEVLQGVASESEAARVEAALRRFDVEPMLESRPCRHRRRPLSDDAWTGAHPSQDHRLGDRQLLHHPRPRIADRRSGFSAAGEASRPATCLRTAADR